MASQFTFVPVDVGANRRQRDHVAPVYRSMIRSLSARNPWNRAVQGQSIIAGVQARSSHIIAPRLPRRRVLMPHGRKLSASSNYSGSQSSSVKVEAMMDPDMIFPTKLPEIPDDALSRRPDPFWKFPIPYRDYMSQILDFKLKFVTRHIPMLDDPSTVSDPSKWVLSQFWTVNRDSPTFLYATLLHSGAFFSAVANPGKQDAHIRDTHGGALSHAISGQEHLLWLRLAAIRAINADLQDPDILHPDKYAKFTSMLCAISTLASYEFYFGDAALQRAHHRALTRLVTLKGGIDALDELQQRIYDFILKVALLSLTSGSRDEGTAEFVASARALRGLLRKPARALGYDDLDAILGPEET